MRLTNCRVYRFIHIDGRAYLRLIPCGPCGMARAIVEFIMTNTNTIDPRTRIALIHVLTVADRRQKSNPYALAHYCGALQHAEELTADGVTLREALMTAFCGPLVARLIKAAGLAPLTEAEIRQVR